MEEAARWAMLLDLYGALLTGRQREALSLHVEEDLSFAEAAQELGITRQGAADAARIAREQLSLYEEKLGLLARLRREEEAIRGALCEARRIGACRIIELLETLTEVEDDGV